MSSFGTLFREMRQGKRLSQMDFALECEVSAKHISFLETGRSKPSKGMVLHLAQMLQTDLAGTNRLLSAAGYSQVYSDQDLSAPGMAMIKEALEHLLQGHLPYPAVVFDHEYYLVMANTAMQEMMVRMVELGAQFPPRPNFLLSLLDYPAIPFTLNLGDQQLRIFSTIATIGTPLDVTAQNLRIEHFFPMDERSKAYWRG